MTDELLSFDKIAEILGVSATTVKRDYAKALEKLKKAMKENGVEEADFRAYLYYIKRDRDF